MREVSDAVLAGMGAATLIAGFLALVWRIARPHVLMWVERQLAPIREDLETVRLEVKPNGGASLKDAAASAQESAESADAKLDQLRDSIHRVGRQVRRVEGRNMLTQSVLDQHVKESATYLRALSRELRHHGMHAPPWGTHEEEEQGEDKRSD